MSRQVAKVLFNGTWIVTWHEKDKVNPYHVYYQCYADGSKKKKLMQKYADFRSCMVYITERTW